MIKTYKYRLYPTSSQIKRLEETFDKCRFLYNCALEERKRYYKHFHKSCSYQYQQNLLPEIKSLFPEYNFIHSQVLQSTLKRLDLAMKSFFRRVKLGEEPGFPRFKGKDRFHSILYPQSGFSIKNPSSASLQSDFAISAQALSRLAYKPAAKQSRDKWCHLFVSKIGHLPMRMHRKMEGILKTCQIIRTPSGKYYVCLTCEQVPKEPLVQTGKEIGIDLGVKNLMTFSDGHQIDNPKHFRKSQEKLASAQRKLSKLSFKNPKRNASKLVVARIHEKIKNQRNDYYHKLSKSLVRDFDRIYLEKLNIKDMKSFRNLNREIQNCGWNQLVLMLLYKAESADKEVVLVDPANTTKECSQCGRIVIKTLSQRIHKCECGLEMDRDLNAAINIYNRGKLCLPRENRIIFSQSEEAPVFQTGE